MIYIALIVFAVVALVAARGGRWPHARRSDLLTGLRVVGAVVVVGLLFGFGTGYAKGKLDAVRPEVETINRTKQSLANKFLSADEAEQRIAAAEAKRAENDRRNDLPLAEGKKRALGLAGLGLLIVAPFFGLFLLRQRLLILQQETTL